MREYTEVKLEDIDLKLVPKFFFEANLLFRWIETDKDFYLMKKKYPDFYKAKVNPGTRNNRIEFGFRMEHTGQQSLGEFLSRYMKEPKMRGELS